jgi:hypothetical protein
MGKEDAEGGGEGGGEGRRAASDSPRHGRRETL